jgi:molecular chaperone HscC
LGGGAISADHRTQHRHPDQPLESRGTGERQSNAAPGRSLSRGSRRTADNIRLGALEIPVPPGPAGREELEVRFTYDIDGLLEVEATALSTGERRQIVIKGNSAAMTEEEIAMRLAGLASLKIPPREQAENRALLARAERLFEEMLRDSREAVRWEILAFEGALESQEPSQICDAYSRLQKFLDKIEHEFQL